MNKLVQLKRFVPLLIVYSTIIFVFRSWFSQLDSILLDLHDYQLTFWIVDQHLSTLLEGRWSMFGSGLMYSPHRNTLWFSDLLLPQAAVTLVFEMMGFARLASFNLMIVATFFLNATASYLLLKRFTSDQFSLWLATNALVFSPFIILQQGHLQMISIWPLLFSMWMILSEKDVKMKTMFFAAVFLVLQFYASVYLAIFGLTIFVMYLFSVMIVEKNVIAFLTNNYTSVLVFLITFLLGTGMGWLTYLQVQDDYQIIRMDGEYTFYAAHLTDYLFLDNRNSVLAPLAEGWQKFNLHKHGEHASFVGFTIFTFGLLGLFKVTNTKSDFQLSIAKDYKKLFLMLLIIIGFIFSLGPRLNANGNFLNIPTPYFFVQRLQPFFVPIRSTARWFLLLNIGFIGASVYGLHSLRKLPYPLIVKGMIALFFLIETIPLGFKNSKVVPRNSNVYLMNNCTESTVLLEYPAHFQYEAEKVMEQLTYRTSLLYDQTEHGCWLVNGYSGWEPLEITAFFKAVDTALHEGDVMKIDDMLETRNVEHIRVHKEMLSPEQAERVGTYFSSTDQYQPEYVDSTTSIFSNK